MFIINFLRQFNYFLFINWLSLRIAAWLCSSYSMDSKIIQFLIQGIVETDEYTLEGIAFYTRIPFDVIYDAACGKSNQFSITPWARVADLYMQVKPEVAQFLIEKLLEMRSKNRAFLSSLLTEL